MDAPLTPPYHFDSDLFLIRIDNHTMMTISNDKSHFIGLICPTNIGVKGFGGNMIKATGKGTLKWKIEDDEGKVHIFAINNALYVLQSSLCILCPQQWAKQANDHYPICMQIQMYHSLGPCNQHQLILFSTWHA